MVESLGYRIRRLFVGVFVAGSALAGLGGVLWGLYQQNVTPQIGAQVNVLIFIVIIIGGLGSTGGCLLGALLVGLLANYFGFVAPKIALFSNILLMTAEELKREQKEEELDPRFKRRRQELAATAASRVNTP